MSDTEGADFILSAWGHQLRARDRIDAPLPSVFGRIASGVDAAAARGPSRSWSAAGLEGDALLAWRALQAAPAELRDVAVAHYVATASAAEKARVLGLSRAAYWERVRCLQAFTAGRVSAFLERAAA